MTDRYRADVPAMTAVAGRLDEAAEGLQAATRALDEGAGGDLGSGDVAAAVEALAQAWAGRLRAVHGDVAAGAQGVMAARDAYIDVDDAVAEELRRGG